MGTRQELGIVLLAVLLSAPAWLGWLKGEEIRVESSASEPCCLSAQPMSGSQRLLAGLKIDPNTASASDLEAIPGIGPALARKIIDEREQRGHFRTMDGLLDVKGIGPKRLEQLRRFLAFEDVSADQPNKTNEIRNQYPPAGIR